MRRISTSALLAVLCAAFLSACSGGGSDNAAVGRQSVASSEFIGAEEVTNAYTVVVGIPSVSAASTSSIYDDLYVNLTSPQAQLKLPISRVLLSVVAPNNNGVFTIDGNSLAVRFLMKIAAFNKSNPAKIIQILAYPDVEVNSPWLQWTIPAAALEIPSCSKAQALISPYPAQAAMLLSMCWTGAMNQFLGSNVLSGVVYDQQSNWLKSDATVNQIAWSYTQAKTDRLLIGWISGNGIAASAGNVDLNFIEVYDLYSGHGPYYETVAPETVVSQSPLFLPPAAQVPPTCTGLLCKYELGNAYPNADGTYKNFFPGPQYTYGSGTSVIGAVGTNIYQCAISTDPVDVCGQAYSTYVDIKQPPSTQIMQAINFIKSNTSRTLPPSNNPYPLYGAAKSLGGEVIYLFSAQYIGPPKSYYGTNPLQTSRNQCSDPGSPPNTCSCLASKYSTNASCGGENGFGVWSGYYSEFSKFTSLFLSSQGGGNCPGQRCSAGIYMYDFIPQDWYQQ